MWVSLLAAASVMAPQTPIERWKDARFGMFIHWGPVTLKGTEIGWSRGAEVPIEEYDNLYKRFNPTQFDAKKWAHLAKVAGMKYVVLTAKHHDGFCLWDTKQSDYNIMHTPFGRDVVKELAKAVRGEGLAFGTYYSTLDWWHPDFPLTSPGGTVRRKVSNLDRYNDYLDAQVKELIQSYGPLWTIWFDVPQEFDRARGERVIAKVRALQPDIVINDRTGAPGDYRTPEQTIGQFDNVRPWETCMTIANQWAWKPNDPVKSLKQCIQTLVRCAGGDGNLLFNISPKPDGSLEPEQVTRLEEMGKWLKRYGKTIYGTRGGPVKPTRLYSTTHHGKHVYVHVLNESASRIELPNLGVRILKAKMLTGGTVKQTSPWVFDLSTAKPDEIDRILDIELSGAVTGTFEGPSDLKVTASNVFENDPNYGPEKAFDGDSSSRWATDNGTHSARIQASFHEPKEVSSVTINEEYAPRVRRFQLVGHEKGANHWNMLVDGTTLGKHFHATFDRVRLDAIELRILDATEGPTISEITLR